MCTCLLCLAIPTTYNITVITIFAISTVSAIIWKPYSFTFRARRWLSLPLSSFFVISVSFTSLARSLNGWSNSYSRPASMTRILSESITVASLWAIISTVQFLKLLFSYSWMKLSVSRSTLAVASSSTRTLVSLMIALARQSNYFYPIEKTLLLSVTSV